MRESGIMCLWGRSSVDRALHSHCRGREFESHRLHQFYLNSRNREFFGGGDNFGVDLVEFVLVIGKFVFGAGFFADVGDMFHPDGELFHLWDAEATSGDGWGAETDSRGTKSGAFVVREGVSIQSEADHIEGFFVDFAVEAERFLAVDENEVVVGAITLEDEALIFELVGEGFGVFDDVFGVGFELRL